LLHIIFIEFKSGTSEHTVECCSVVTSDWRAKSESRINTRKVDQIKVQMCYM